MTAMAPTGTWTADIDMLAAAATLSPPVARIGVDKHFGHDTFE